jgi:hypothetical protein
MDSCRGIQRERNAVTAMEVYCRAFGLRMKMRLEAKQQSHADTVSLLRFENEASIISLHECMSVYMHRLRERQSGTHI